MIESYDITTVEPVGNYLVGKYIKENTDCKEFIMVMVLKKLWVVIYGYLILIMKKIFTENLKLLGEISYYDVLRSDRSISDNGLEPEYHLDKKFVDYVMSIHPKYKMFGNGIIEKILREAFEHTNLLPREVLFRKKGFQTVLVLKKIMVSNYSRTFRNTN